MKVMNSLSVRWMHLAECIGGYGLTWLWPYDLRDKLQADIRLLEAGNYQLDAITSLSRCAYILRTIRGAWPSLSLFFPPVFGASLVDIHPLPSAVWRKEPGEKPSHENSVDASAIEYVWTKLKVKNHFRVQCVGNFAPRIFRISAKRPNINNSP